MPHVVTKNCVNCKYTTCVDVCPVEAFREGDSMLVIHESCIDCGACITECPVNAIIDPIDESLSMDEKDISYWVEYNAKKSEEWPKILESRDKK